MSTATNTHILYLAHPVDLIRALDAVKEGSQDLFGGGETAMGEEEHSHEVLLLEVWARELLKQFLEGCCSNLYKRSGRDRSEFSTINSYTY